MVVGLPLTFGERLEETPIRRVIAWAEFHANRRWIPVDCLAADVHPDLSEFWFGHLKADRIRLSSGHNVKLIPPAAAGALSFFAFPYAEADGGRWGSLTWKATFRDVP